MNLAITRKPGSKLSNHPEHFLEMPYFQKLRDVVFKSLDLGIEYGLG
jgi:hypothetical protein